MCVVQVDVINSETRQRDVTCLLAVLGRRVDKRFTLAITLVCKFGGKKDVVALARVSLEPVACFDLVNMYFKATRDFIMGLPIRSSLSMYMSVPCQLRVSCDQIQSSCYLLCPKRAPHLGTACQALSCALHQAWACHRMPIDPWLHIPF
jgi:hypothetical protein